MKYVWIFVAVIVFVRIDLVLHLYDKIADKIETQRIPEVQPSEVSEPNEIISMKDDMTLRQTPRTVFFTLMDDFRLNPNASVREDAMTVLLKHPDLLRAPKDEQFEATLFRWRDLVVQNVRELPLFLNDLLAVTKGENLELVKRFYSLILDHNVETFLLNYPRAKDPNCVIAAVTSDRLTPQTKYTVLFERDQEITEFLNRDKIDPLLQVYASSCQMVVKVEWR